jgi:hypothetical protein
VPDVRQPYAIQIVFMHFPPWFGATQVHSSADALKLITFDADGTLYADGAHFDQDNAMIAHIVNLMRCNVHVSLESDAELAWDSLG